MHPTVVVFDIDGTLTDTMDVDVECYNRAVLEVIGVEIPSNWSDFDEVTDRGILETACHLAGREPPDEASCLRAAERTGELLRDALQRAPERFEPVPGARSVFRRLEEAGCVVAMATGAWRPSAVVKLRGAGIDVGSVPLVTSSEHRARREIIRAAATQAAGLEPARATYVGDGVWDGRAAEELGYRFVGIGRPGRARRLYEVGASVVLTDLTDAAALLE